MIRKRGFTLIELLVVIAIIALLLAIMVPALKSAKELASGSVCLSNQKNLCIAWTTYSSDYDSQLVGGSNYYSGTRATPYRWVEYPLVSDKDNPEVTAPASTAQYSIETRKNGIRAGKLFPYTLDEDLYHCPGDRNMTRIEPAAVFRSYAITGLMNGEDFISRSGGIYSPISQYRTASGMGGKRLYVVTKTSEIVSPGNKHVFVEEDVAAKGQNVNAGGFVLLANGAYNWWDWPAYYHNDSSTIGFADGHAERHRWMNVNTLKLMRGEIGSDPDPLNNEDLKWMVGGYLPKP
ncbi:MAG: prepilin-type N-terminal cleavage/methylation domain-containing protein [Anaerohalosphaeraceae bacterium]